MSRLAHELRTSTREVYVQGRFISGGIQLQDLRDLVAATADYSDFSHVELDRNRIKVTETKQQPWRRVGRGDS